METKKRTVWAAMALGLTGAAMMAAAVAASPQQGEKKPAPAAKDAKPEKADEPAKDVYIVTGRVFEADGKKPMEGVKVTASVGYGTLFKAAEVNTDKDGNFRITLPQGLKGTTAGGVAIVWAWKPGYSAWTYSTWPTYLMSTKPLPQEELKPGKYANLVLGKESKLTFFMEPAAHLRAKLVDGAGKPLAKTKVWLAGEKLRPGGSVIAAGETDENGVFVARDLPTSRYRLVMGDKANTRRELELGSIDFADPVEYTAEATIHSWKPEATKLEFKVTRGEAAR